MEDFNRIFNLEKNFNEKNQIILSYYNNKIGCIDDSNRINNLQDDLKNYEDSLDDINRRLSSSDSFCDRMSLLVERDNYLESLMLSCGLNEFE